MKLTRKQLFEKENLEWFNPSLLKQYPPQEGEFEEYLAHSERGKPIKGFPHGQNVFNVYSEAKRRRGITIHELWEKSFYENEWMGFYDLLKEENGILIPEHIKDYIKREIFKGQSADLIDKLYEELKKMVLPN